MKTREPLRLVKFLNIGFIRRSISLMAPRESSIPSSTDSIPANMSGASFCGIIVQRTGSLFSKEIIMVKRLATAALLLVLFSLHAFAQRGAAASCDRACLRGFITQYLDAMVAHN